jgi:uncharacterized protein (DUF58 family)
MRPTAAGWAVLAAAVICYPAAVILGYPELAELAAGCVAVLTAALAWVLPVPKLEVHREIAPLRVARGGAAVGVVTVASTGRRVRAGLRAADRCGEDTVAVEIPRLPAGGSRTVSYRLSTQRRGEIPVGPLRLARTDPFGLVRREHDYGSQATLLVHPRTYPLPLLPAGRSHHLEGPTSDTAPRGTVTFHALREYVPGDDLRHIHWRATARTGTLMVRELVDASLPHTTIVLDNRASVYLPGGHGRQAGAGEAGEAASELFESAVEAAASVAVAAAGHGFPVRVLTAAGLLAESRGDRAAAGTLLDRFATVRPNSGGSLAAPLTTVHGSGVGALVVVTPWLDPAESRLVAATRLRFGHTVVIRLAAGQDPPGLPTGVSTIDAADPAEVSTGWHRAAGKQ